MFRTTSASTSGAEQGIHNYIPLDLQRMFYRNPARVHASHNGLDPYGFMTRGLVLYLPLWALKGSAFKSVDAYGHICTPAGTAPVWAPQGWSLPGTDEYINCGTDPSLDITVAITVLAWIKPTQACLDAASSEIVSMWVNPHKFSFRLETGEINFYIMDGSVTKGPARGLTTLGTGWSLPSAVYDGSNGKVYLNGVYDTGTFAHSGDIDSSGGLDLLVGANAVPTGFFTGIVGEVWVYNRALTVAEMLHIYNCTAWRYQ